MKNVHSVRYINGFSSQARAEGDFLCDVMKKRLTRKAKSTLGALQSALKAGEC